MVRHAIVLMGMVVAGCVVSPCVSIAQTRATAGSLPPFRMPRVMISAGLGIGNDFRAGGANGNPIPAVSVRFLPTRHLVVEGEFEWWEETWDYRRPNWSRSGAVNGEAVETHAEEGWWGGVNLLYRTEPRRVSVFVGGGPVWLAQRFADSYRLEGCVPTNGDECPRPLEYEFRHMGPWFQAVAGADVHIVGPILAYGSVQFVPTEGLGVRTWGGIRFVAVKRRPASASN